MTPEQYWDGEAELARHYRLAYEMRREKENEAAWIQGAYILDAIVSAFEGRKAPYPAKPYTLNTGYSRKRDAEERRRAERENMLLEREKFLQWARKANERLEQKAKAQAEPKKGDAT